MEDVKELASELHSLRIDAHDSEDDAPAFAVGDVRRWLGLGSRPDPDVPGSDAQALTAADVRELTERLAGLLSDDAAAAEAGGALRGGERTSHAAQALEDGAALLEQGGSAAAAIGSDGVPGRPAALPRARTVVQRVFRRWRRLGACRDVGDRGRSGGRCLVGRRGSTTAERGA